MAVFGTFSTELMLKKTPIEGLLLHHTSDAAFDNFLKYMSRRDEGRGGTFGYHFLMGQDGRVAKTVPLSNRTNHVKPEANRTSAQHITNNNSCSLSLYAGYKELSTGETMHLPASDEQLSSAKIVLKALENIINIPLEESWGYGEVQNDRMMEEALVLVKWCREPVIFA